MKFSTGMLIEDVPAKFRGAFKRWKNRVNTPINQLFWNNVKSGPPGECWPYVAAISRNSYGSFRIPGDPPKAVRAHRLAWILVNGHIPDGMCVCHKCDNPPCCNPTHLFIGSKKENSDDMIQKGRKFIPAGDKSPTHKLSVQQVLEIRRRYHPAKTTYALLAKEFGVSAQSVRELVNGVTWKNIPMPKREVFFNRGEAHPKAKLTEDQVREIREIGRSGEKSKSQIARDYGVGYASISGILNGTNWTHV